MNTDELKELARQLKQPEGARGIKVAHNMTKNNINMILSSIRALNINKNDRILELGHGLCKHLSSVLTADNTAYFGLETSELMYEESKKENINFIDSKQASFHLYDGENIPFSYDFFDKIFSVNTLYFWKKPTELLLEIYRVLKPKGIFCLTFAQKEFMEKLPFTQFNFELYTNEKVTDLIKTIGFKLINSVPIKEKVISKAGDPVDRLFTVMTLQK